VSAAEITFLIHTLEELRQTQSSVYTNRNKFANAFAFLLASEVSNSDDFKKLLFEGEDLGSAVPTGSEAMEVDEERKEGEA